MSAVWARPTPDAFKPHTVPSPVGGLNAFDPLAAMAETDAIVMQNWWPQPYGCAVRNGYIEWTTGLPSTVESLAGWFNLAGDQKMFAWSDDSMFDISTRGAAGAAIVSALTNAIWQTIVLTNSAGNSLICVNGQDDGIIYDNGGVDRIVAGDGIVANTWDGLSPDNAIQLTVHQRRLWAVQKDSSLGWYLPPDAIQGTFVSFDFGPLFSKGGALQYLTTWTLDDGNGAQDHLVAVSSQGEAVIYAGTDPNLDQTWSLQGVYFVGAPVAGRRSFVKAGGDIFMLTQQGVVSLSSMLVSTKVDNQAEHLISHKIQFLISELIQAYTALNGWNLIYHPPLNMTLVNVPSVTAGGNIQLASNMITRSWTEFTNMDSNCWLSHNQQLYFGDYTGKVYQAWTGSSDKVLLDNTGGEGVTAAVQQAYNYFGGRANQKQVGLYRPTFMSGGEVAYNTDVVYDFGDQTLTTPSAAGSAAGDLWDAGRWDSAHWSGGVGVSQAWISAQGEGVCGSLKMVTLTASETLWVATDYTLVQSRGVL